MKILLLNPSFKQSRALLFEQYLVRSGSRWPHTGLKFKAMRPHYLPFPFFLATAAAVLKKKGHDTVGLDAVALDLSLHGMLYFIEKTKADVVVFEPTAASLKFDIELCSLIKENSNPQTKIVLCGAFASRAGEKFLSACPCVDFVISGEYEIVLSQLVDFIAGKIKIIPAGVFYCNENEPVFAGQSTLLKDLDALPFADRNIFPSAASADSVIYYWDGFCRRRPALQIYVSRGCFFSCKFCLWKNSLFSGAGYRAATPSRVVEHINALCADTKVKEIYFDDDDFTAAPERVKELCRKIIAQGIDVEWSCMGSVAGLDRSLIELMAKAGCRGIKIGVESAAPEILTKLGKTVDPEHVVRVVRWCKEYGIRTHATFVVGLEGENEDTLQCTRRFINALDVDSLQVSIAAPLPDCAQLFDDVVKNNTKGTPVLRQYDGKTGRSKQLLKWRKAMLRGWVLRRIFTKRFWKNINDARRGTGTGFFLKQGVSVFIDEMHNS